MDALAEHARREFGHIDVWVNNAAVSAPYGPTVSVSPERFMGVIRTNITGVYNGSHAAMRHFLAQRDGKLISVLGRGDSQTVPFQNAYASSKCWAYRFTLALAKEYQGSGVEVMAFNPGLMLTDFLTRVEVAPGFEDRIKPLGTIACLWGNPPERPAQTAVWLASSSTDGRTGLVVNSLGPSAMVGGVLREGLRRLLGRSAGPVPITIHTS